MAKAELCLGLAQALTEVMGLKENLATVDPLVDLNVDVQTSRTCLTASKLEPEMTEGSYTVPGQLHLPLVFVVDDLHWGDGSSLLLLEFLAREIRDGRQFFFTPV